MKKKMIKPVKYEIYCFWNNKNSQNKCQIVCCVIFVVNIKCFYVMPKVNRINLVVSCFLK